MRLLSSLDEPVHHLGRVACLFVICLTGCLKTDPPPHPDDPRIRRGVQEKLQLSIEERWSICNTAVTERAMEIVDSLVLAEIQRRRIESLHLPPPATRPSRPPDKAPLDSGIPAPLWDESDTLSMPDTPPNTPVEKSDSL